MKGITFKKMGQQGKQWESYGSRVGKGKVRDTKLQFTFFALFSSYVFQFTPSTEICK